MGQILQCGGHFYRFFQYKESAVAKRWKIWPRWQHPSAPHDNEREPQSFIGSKVMYLESGQEWLSKSCSPSPSVTRCNQRGVYGMEKMHIAFRSCLNFSSRWTFLTFFSNPKITRLLRGQKFWPQRVTEGGTLKSEGKTFLKFCTRFPKV